MKDLKENADTEMPIEGQNDFNNETSESADNVQKAAEKKIIVKAKDKPTRSRLAKSVPEVTTEISTHEVDISKAAKPIVKKTSKAESKIIVEKPEKKLKADGKKEIQNEVETPETPDKKNKKKQKIKVIKKNAKKAEEKVDKLKKKVKKAKKKEVKPSKIKALKEKLGKALDRLRSSIKKLKKVKK